MKITLTSINVDDQAAALAFYTEKLGFELVHDIPLGEHRWISLVAPEDRDGTQLVLEPGDHPAVGPFRRALVADGIPITSFTVDDVQAEYDRLVGLGVEFTQPPVAMGPVTTAVLDDTVGNLVQIASPPVL